MRKEPQPPQKPAPATTSEKLADAAHFKTIASSLAAFLKAANNANAEDLSFHRQLIRESYDDVCEILVDAERLTGNRELEMAEAIAELQRIKEACREFLT